MSEIKKDQFKRERRELWCGVAIAVAGTGAHAITIKGIADDVVKSFDAMFKKDKNGDESTGVPETLEEAAAIEDAPAEEIAETPTEDIEAPAEETISG